MRTFCISLLVLLLAGACAAQGPGERTITLRGLPLAAALDSLSLWYGIPIVYRAADVREQRVTVSCESCGFELALARVLDGTELDAVGSSRQVIIRKHQSITHANEGTIAGTVRDAVTGDAIVGAIVILRRRDTTSAGTLSRLCPTNAFGFFSLRSVPGGDYLVETRYVGYQGTLHQVTLAEGEEARQEIMLRQGSISLEEMTVEGERMTGATGSVLARGLFIRSIPGDPHEYLLDGARIYNPAHIGGVMSTFHPEALNEIEISTGGLPPSFGGRIGGVMDLSLRDGMRERITGSAGADLLGAQASIEGPVSDDAAFLVTARRGWPDAQIAGLDEHGIPTRLGTGEVIAKMSGRLSPGSRLTANAYISSDQYTNASASPAGTLSNDLRWWNTSVNLRWSAIVSSSLFAHAAATYTRYGFGLEHTLAPAVTAIQPSFYRIEDLSVRAEAEHYYDVTHTLSGGVEITRHLIEGSISGFDAVVAPFVIDAQELWEFSLYARDRVVLRENVTAELGVRATSFIGPATTLSGIDPRLGLHVAFSPVTRAYVTFASINQFMHPYRQSGTFLCYPIPFWYPSDEQVTSSTSVQFTAGVIRDIGSDDLVLGAEGFYRYASRLHDAPWYVLPAGDLANALVTGSGRSYGIDVSLRKRTGPFSGAISYTYASTERTFSSLNGGLPFVPPFTASHEIHLSAGYVPDADWLVGVLAVFAPGSSRSQDAVTNASSPSYPYDNAGIRAALASDFTDVNGSRLPGFERLEVSVGRRITMGGLVGNLSLRLINGYGLLDPVSWVYIPGSDQRSLWRAQIRAIDLFPLYPVVGLSLRF